MYKSDFFWEFKGFPKGGGGGSAIWEKFPNNPVIFLYRRTLADLTDIFSVLIVYWTKSSNGSTLEGLQKVGFYYY